jgi:general nucleoside transport system ATP-binding protein
MTPVLRLEGITKRFGPLVANDAISLDLARGEVLALLGENGAGKSTLVSILFGHYVADAGTIEVEGRALPPGEPKAALAAGIGMVHQHFTLAGNLSVLDNVMLGTEALWQPFSRREAARARLVDAAQRFGLAVVPEARVADLSVGERQRVEILKALVRGARILILDEPTAVLTPQESESLFATLAQMVAEGLSIIFISHKLDEVLRVSHRIAVLRSGRLVATLPAAGASKAMLAEAMVGRRVAPAQKPRLERGALVCTLPGTPLALHAGEVLAIAGVAGNGQQSLAEVLCGERANPYAHEPLQLAGALLPPGARRFVRAGVARVPEDRQAVGLVGEMSLAENVLLERYAPRRCRAATSRSSSSAARSPRMPRAQRPGSSSPTSPPGGWTWAPWPMCTSSCWMPAPRAQRCC